MLLALPPTITATSTAHGALGGAILDYYCGDLDEAREAINERYMGEHASLADYVQEMTEDSMTIPQSLHYYIDWQAIVRDIISTGKQ